MHKGIRADFGKIRRTTTPGRFKVRTQRGTSEIPSPLSTNVITVVMKSGSLTMRGEKPARRQTAMTSFNDIGAAEGFELYEPSSVDTNAPSELVPRKGPVLPA